MKYLSLFSGIGGFELGINAVFPGAECIGYSEINKYAIKIYEKHFPKHKPLGDITSINPFMLPDFDMLVGGFPCQDLSIANAKRKGLAGERSGLFWDMLSIVRIKNPRWFCFENVYRMPAKDRDTITKELGVEPVMIDAALVSGQRRRRLFWCNWDVSQPNDKGIMLADVLEKNPDVPALSQNRIDWILSESGLKRMRKKQIAINPDKALTLTSRSYASWDGNYIYQLPHGYNAGGIKKDKAPTITVRMLSPIECERLQGFPDGWTEGVSNRQRYKLLGNALQVDVVKHLMSCLDAR